MKKLSFKSRTLDEDIVRDGLCAVSKLESDPYSAEQSFVVGGVATQSYLPTSCRRGTSDIDLAVLRPLNHAEFKRFAQPVIQYLASNGYSFNTKKEHNSFQITYSDKECNASVIEFARRNQTNYDKRSQRLAREFENSRVKVVEERKDTYRVCSPEDIVIPKLVRDVGILTRHPKFTEFLDKGFSFPITDHELANRLNEIYDLRQEATIHIGDPTRSERLRFVSDMYDIQILSEIAGFNPHYLGKVFSSWDVLKERTEQRDKLTKALLPKYSVDNL